MLKAFIKRLAPAVVGLLRIVRPKHQASVEILEPAVPVKLAVVSNAGELPVALNEKLLSRYTTFPSQIIRIQDALVTSDGVAYSALRLENASLVWPRFEIDFGNAYLLRQLASKKKVAAGKNEVLALPFDHWSATNYYHWMIDTLPRLLILEKSAPDCTVLLPEAGASYITETLSLFSFVKYRVIKKDQVVTARQLLVPMLTAASGLQNPLHIREIVGRIKRSISSQSQKPFRKVYVSRERQRRKVRNEQDLLQMIQAKGYELHFFEDLNFREQVQLMSETAVLLTPHGANMTNLMFMNEETTVIELGNNQVPNPCYRTLANSVGLEYFYEPCSTGEVFHEHGDITVDLDSLSASLEKIEKKLG
jgi:hypothetical protein